jgi:hypothetical protein
MKRDAAANYRAFTVDVVLDRGFLEWLQLAIEKERCARRKERRARRKERRAREARR